MRCARRPLPARLRSHANLSPPAEQASVSRELKDNNNKIIVTYFEMTSPFVVGCCDFEITITSGGNPVFDGNGVPIVDMASGTLAAPWGTATNPVTGAAQISYQFPVGMCCTPSPAHALASPTARVLHLKWWSNLAPPPLPLPSSLGAVRASSLR